MLQIKDFKFPAVAQNTDNDVQGEIIIPYPELAEYLNRAEECPDETIDEIISSQSDPNLSNGTRGDQAKTGTHSAGGT